MVGAACITAILNANRTHEMPMYLVAAESSEHVKLALFKTKNLAQSCFSLSLRIGAVSVNKVGREDIDALIGKFCLSPRRAFLSVGTAYGPARGHAQYT
jgi:hypothetical protein